MLFRSLNLKADYNVNINADYDVNIKALNESHVYVGRGKYFAVHGNIAVDGTGKGCIIETADFGKRWLYAVEGPEIRLEDKGIGVLVDGQCRVELNAQFLQTIEKDTPETPWLIDVTPYFKAKLYVSEIGENYFVVSDCDDVLSNGRFSWSISAVKIGCTGIYMPEFEPEGDVLTSNWEDDLL